MPSQNRNWKAQALKIGWGAPINCALRGALEEIWDASETSETGSLKVFTSRVNERIRNEGTRQSVD
jgi:hypothetical protein